jgi:hypothetical protein
MCIKDKKVFGEKAVGNSGISISIDYNHSFRYENKKGKWLVLKTIVENNTSVPQEAAYEFILGKLCEYIKVDPTLVMRKNSTPLAQKTINATVANKRFVIEPGAIRQDVLVVTDFEESYDWRVGVADVTVLIDKNMLEERSQL